MSEITYEPPRGRPLGTNGYFRFGASVLIPILSLITKRDWRGVENIPQSGPVIVVCNHISYADPLVFAQFLYQNGRAPRFLGKASVFKVPVIGKIIAGSGQIPVERETEVSVRAGAPLEFSRWKGKEDDPEALKEATEYVMSAITRLLEEIRGEYAPAQIFDPHTSNLPRTGNYKKVKRLET